MSGGSFNYLCHKELEELFHAGEDLQSMSDELAELGYADDAARETEELILILRQFRNRMDTRLARLSPVWHAMEWWRSCNTDEEDFKEALAKYRENVE